MPNQEFFTPRQIEVLRLLIKGCSNEQIATQLNVCSKTVEFHLQQIYSRLNVSSRCEAVCKVLQDNLIEIK